MSTLHLLPVEEPDIPAMVCIYASSWLPHEHAFVDIMYPNSKTETGLANLTKHWQAAHKKIPNERHLKVIDTTTGTPILQGRWLVPCSGPDLETIIRDPIVSGDWWSSEDEKEWAQHLLVRYTQRRRDMFKEANGNVFACANLTVSPEAQGRGAGRLFLEWGISQADAMGAPCCVEASLRSWRFYERFGFERVEECRFEPPERWRGRKVQEYVWMVRPAKLKQAK